MLQVSKVKQLYRNRQMVLQTMLRFPDPGAAEIMAMTGADLIVIDNEHYPFSVSQIESIVRAAQAFGGECAVRVPNSEPKRISQIMETGISGILVPHVETYEEAMTVVNAVKYAPVGTRGFCPITRAAAYGMRMSQSDEVAGGKIVSLFETETDERSLYSELLREKLFWTTQMRSLFSIWI